MTTNYKYPPEYWNRFFKENQLGWDVGYVSTPLKKYFDQLEDRSIKILIPGSGSGWEAEYLFSQGFRNVFYHDFSPLAHKAFLKRNPKFQQEQMLLGYFFTLEGGFDMIVEQTFFSSIPRNRRKDYARQVYHLLNPGGKFAGLLFNHEFHHNYPPFGGSHNEYNTLFFNLFQIKTFEVAFNSIKPREKREFFFILKKPTS